VHFSLGASWGDCKSQQAIAMPTCVGNRCCPRRRTSLCVAANSFAPNVKCTLAQTVVDNDLSQPYKHAYWAEIPDWAKDKDGKWSAGAWGAIAFTVNKDKVKNVPQKWDDLLKPEYKDTICMKDPRSSATANMVVLAAAIAKGGDEKNVKPGLDFFKQLKASGALRPVSPSTSNIQKGECPISLFFDFDGLSKKRDLKMNLETD
jgi:putative spermidine/putrescine transport system substrate-binding protein